MVFCQRKPPAGQGDQSGRPGSGAYGLVSVGVEVSRLRLEPQRNQAGAPAAGMFTYLIIYQNMMIIIILLGFLVSGSITFREWEIIA